MYMLICMLKCKACVYNYIAQMCLSVYAVEVYTHYPYIWECAYLYMYLWVCMYVLLVHVLCLCLC